MLWKLIYLLKSYFSPFNVFKYITFRATYALVTALLVSLLFGPSIISWLRRLKIGQVIREYGPKTHLSKAGTPTMGGILIILAVMVSAFVWFNLSNPLVLISVFTLLSFGLVGLVDDYIKVSQKNPEGIGAKKKFIFQIILALIIAALIVKSLGHKATVLQVPFFKKVQPDLGWFYVPFAAFVIVATSNAVNITDGLDGLAIVPFSLCMAAYGLIAYLAGHVKFASYLNIIYVPYSGELTVVAAAFVGASIGFLWFNAHPAEIFMGDTGSLSIGATLGAVALMTKHELLLPIMGGVFVLETVSVILQVLYFKATGGKRIFRMAPIHHHYEQEGLPEPKIIVRFWIVSLILVLIGLSTLKIR